ncbi:MAG: hypothetical protein HFJ52_08750 [Clostridia bacterium]|nr:hypothetical protein [Clostridia bacterium]
MEKKLVEIFRLANTLSDKKYKVYAQIEYSATEQKELTLSIRSKSDYSYLEKCNIQLNQSYATLDSIILLLRYYIGGQDNE